MAPDPRIRASDSDRDRVAGELREHCAQGRLTIEELNERLEDTYAAKTIGDLQRLTADLPEEDLHQLPVPARQRGTSVRRGTAASLQVTGMRAAWVTWASASAITLSIWLISAIAAGEWTFPWWLWVAGPWGAGLLIRQILGPRRPDGD
jgi:hypothetical protein